MNKCFESVCFQNRSRTQKHSYCYCLDKRHLIVFAYALRKCTKAPLLYLMKTSCCLIGDFHYYCFQCKTKKNLNKKRLIREKIHKFFNIIKPASLLLAVKLVITKSKQLEGLYRKYPGIKEVEILYAFPKYIPEFVI